MAKKWQKSHQRFLNIVKFMSKLRHQQSGQNMGTKPL